MELVRQRLEPRAITGTLALVGGLVLSFALRWWIVLVVLAVLVVVIGFVGSFRVWEDAELRAGAGRASFPDLVVTAEDALWLDPEESRDFPGEYESLVCVRVRVTNREPDRKANLRFTLHAGVKRPFEHKMELPTSPAGPCLAELRLRSTFFGPGRELLASRPNLNRVEQRTESAGGDLRPRPKEGREAGEDRLRLVELDGHDFAAVAPVPA